MPSERIETLVNELERPIAKGAQVYWVCPLVAESEVLDMAAAEERHAALQKRFGDKVGLVHGRLPGKAKGRVMAAFAAGDLSILVSTTVIEVGVDVPNASIMVIEHAERFGLAQLHQLRGRVGRGAAQSSCILLYRTRQSGLPEFRVARLPEDEALLQAARDEARLTLTRNPDLTGPHADELKLLLYLFERDDTVQLMRAG
jgi:ATP-dependent DNA helicase RecG